jgi:hypothetical protein
VNKIVEWDASGHYMNFKFCNFFVLACFKRIEEHVARPKHAQNIKK